MSQDQLVRKRLGRRDGLRLLAGVAATGLFSGTAFEAFAAASPSGILAPHREQLFNSGWLFHLGDVPNGQAVGLSDGSWRSLDVPHDFTSEDLPNPNGTDQATADPALWATATGPTVIGPFIQVPTTSDTLGDEESIAWTQPNIGWYRKHFRVSSGGAADRVFIRFDGVYQAVDVYLNGVHLGFHPYGYTAFTFDLTRHLLPDQTNVLALRVNALGYTSRWYPGAGIYRSVWLEQTGAFAIPHDGVHITSQNVSPTFARVTVTVEIDAAASADSATTLIRLYDPNGTVVASGTTREAVTAGHQNLLSVELQIANPALWSLDTPNLYQAEVAIAVHGQISDVYYAPFGVRSLTIDATNGLLLNGVQIKLKGGCAHHTNGFLGSVAIDRAEYKRVEWLKAAGFNAVRTAHNPPSSAFLDACDQLGLFVYEEAFDTWDVAKRPQDYSVYFARYGVSDAERMVRRDRNHPSVFLWSIGNEINDLTTPTGTTIGMQLYDAIRRNDHTRLITAGGMAGGGRGPTLTGPQWSYLDVGDTHYVFDSYPAAHALYPTKPMICGESWGYEAYDFWQPVLQYPYVIGDFVWTAIDYIGEPGVGHCDLAPAGSTSPQIPTNGIEKTFPWFISGSGDIDPTGNRKPKSYMRAVVWGDSNLEMLVRRPTPAGMTQQFSLWGYYDELESWTWPGFVGQTLTIDVFTSGARVDLLLNGALVARNTLQATDKMHTIFNVPYAPGELTAVSFRNGSVLATKTILTAGKPASVRLVADRDTITSSRLDLSYITAEIVDESGALVPDAVFEVNFTVGGVAELAAVGSGNPRNMASWKQPHHYTYHGVAQAILRPLGRPGHMTLRAEVAGLRSASIVVSAS